MLHTPVEIKQPASTTHQVLVSVHGLPSVVNINSLNYIDFVQSGNYMVAAAGSKRTCEEIKEQLLEEFITE